MGACCLKRLNRLKPFDMFINRCTRYTQSARQKLSNAKKRFSCWKLLCRFGALLNGAGIRHDVPGLAQALCACAAEQVYKFAGQFESRPDGKCGRL